eukprot:6088214-Pyramimonas_sp.AAC.1
MAIWDVAGGVCMGMERGGGIHFANRAEAALCAAAGLAGSREWTSVRPICVAAITVNPRPLRIGTPNVHPGVHHPATGPSEPTPPSPLLLLPLLLLLLLLILLLLVLILLIRLLLLILLVAP